MAIMDNIDGEAQKMINEVNESLDKLGGVIDTNSNNKVSFITTQGSEIGLPTGYYKVMTVSPENGQEGYQIAIGYYGGECVGKVHRRTFVNGAYEDWDSFALNSDLSDLRYQVVFQDGRTMDDLTTYGHYSIYNETDNPIAGWCNVIVLPYNNDANYLHQIVTSMGTSCIYYRMKGGDLWTGWYRVINHGDLANYLPLSGGQLTGDLKVGKYITFGTDSEGGRFVISSVEGPAWEMDVTASDVFRLFAHSNGKPILFTKDGQIGDNAGHWLHNKIDKSKFTISNGVLTINLD